MPAKQESHCRGAHLLSHAFRRTPPLLDSELGQTKVCHWNKKGKNRAKRTIFTRDKVSEADCGEGDDDKVDGLQRAPALDVLEDDGGQGHEDEAAEEDEEQRGEHADLCLADFPLLLGD